jgi:hypothetical protein
MRVFKFFGVTKVGQHLLLPGIPLGFEAEDAVPSFLAAKWGEETDEEPAHVYTVDEISIDPALRHHESGLLIADVIAKEEIV